MKNLVIAGVLGDEAARTSDALPVPPARDLFSLKTRLRKTCKFTATFAFLGRKGSFCATKMFYIHFVKFFVRKRPENTLFCNKKWSFCSQFYGFAKLPYFLHFAKTAISPNRCAAMVFRKCLNCLQNLTYPKIWPKRVLSTNLKFGDSSCRGQFHAILALAS